VADIAAGYLKGGCGIPATAPQEADHTCGENRDNTDDSTVKNNLKA
jgi:hypothetical protein